MREDVIMRLNSQQSELLRLVVDRWELGSLDELVSLALAECAGELTQESG